MNAFKCDLCKKYQDKNPRRVECTAWATILNRMASASDDWKRYELCKECYDKILEFSVSLTKIE